MKSILAIIILNINKNQIIVFTHEIHIDCINISLNMILMTNKSNGFS